MRILVVGGGGREHAIIKKLRENPCVDEIYALPDRQRKPRQLREVRYSQKI